MVDPNAYGYGGYPVNTVPNPYGGGIPQVDQSFGGFK